MNNQMKELRENSFFVKRITICKSGTQYDAVLAGYSSTINNGKWTINALGNGMVIEPHIVIYAKKNQYDRSNTLLINGPSVCISGGYPTRYQFGAGFEAGLQYLEKEVRATHIVMYGLSLGGGMMSEAILNHDFTTGLKHEVKYLSISDRTFDYLSNVASKMMHLPLQPIFSLSGMELDCVGAAKTLSDHNIRHIIIQHSSPNNASSDGVIPDNASLAAAITQNPNLQNKRYLLSENIDHNFMLPGNIQEALDSEINIFFG